MMEDKPDPTVSEIMMKPAPSSFNDNSVIVLFQAMRDDIKEMREMHQNSLELHQADVTTHREVLNTIVGWDKCSTLRSQCHVDNGEKFNDIFQQLDAIKEVCAEYKSNKENTVTPLSLSRAEGNVLDKAREEDGKVLEELEKIKDSVRNIENKLVIFNFSRCSLVWLWQNKKSVIAIIVVVTLWIFGIDLAAKLSCAYRLI